jgi:hypothetical protein
MTIPPIDHGSPLKILITNNTLATRAGSELYVRDLASALTRKGHAVAAYSTVIGEVGDELRGSGVPVFGEISQVPFEPDIIHGQHHLEVMTALHQFPGIPVVYFCHGFAPWEEIPPLHPRIVQYVAVDEPTRRSCIERFNVPEDKIRMIFNFVDLDRFKPRGPLPQTPRRALVFSNQASEDNYVSIVREACLKSGMQLDVRGINSGAIEKRPERLLGHYDIVFAKARCALEAMAVGTAVILCDESGVGPMVSTDLMDDLRPRNFGHTTLETPFSVESLLGQIHRYRPRDAAGVSEKIRSAASLEGTLPSIVALYQQAIATLTITRLKTREESLAVAKYVRLLSDDIKKALWENSQLETLRNTGSRQAQELESLRNTCSLQDQELESLRSTFVMQFRERVLTTPLLRSFARVLARTGKRILGLCKQRGHV